MVELCTIGSGLNVMKHAVAIIHLPSRNCRELLSGCLELLLKVVAVMLSLLALVVSNVLHSELLQIFKLT